MQVLLFFVLFRDGQNGFPVVAKLDVLNLVVRVDIDDGVGIFIYRAGCIIAHPESEGVTANDNLIFGFIVDGPVATEVESLAILHSRNAEVSAGRKLLEFADSSKTFDGIVFRDLWVFFFVNRRRVKNDLEILVAG